MVTAVTPAAARPASPEALPVELARALGDPLRWRIVELLSTEQLCVAHLAEELQTAQPLVSHHLKVLRRAGLIEPDRYRYWTYYRLRPGALVRLAATLGLVARSAPSGTACRRQVPGTDDTPPPVAARPAAPPGGRPMPFRDTPMDPISRQTFARSIEALHEEFRGIYSLETIERYVNEAIGRLSGARVVDFIPLFVHRFSREQLRALAQAEGAIIKDVPEVLFVCVHNAGRSQMAAALLERHAKGRLTMLGCFPDRTLSDALARWVAAESLPVDPWGAAVGPTQSHLACRTAEGCSLHLIHNWSWQPSRYVLPASVTLLGADTSFSSGQPIELGAWDVQILLEEGEMS